MRHRLVTALLAAALCGLGSGCGEDLSQFDRAELEKRRDAEVARLRESLTSDLKLIEEQARSDAERGTAAMQTRAKYEEMKRKTVASYQETEKVVRARYAALLDASAKSVSQPPDRAAAMAKPPAGAPEPPTRQNPGELDAIPRPTYYGLYASKGPVLVELKPTGQIPELPADTAFLLFDRSVKTHAPALRLQRLSLKPHVSQQDQAFVSGAKGFTWDDWNKATQTFSQEAEGALNRSESGSLQGSQPVQLRVRPVSDNAEMAWNIPDRSLAPGCYRVNGARFWVERDAVLEELRGEARAAVAKHDWVEAYRAASAVTTAEPRDPDMSGLLAELPDTARAEATRAMDAGQWGAAQRDLAELMRVYPKEAWIQDLYRSIPARMAAAEAAKHFEAGRWNDAISMAEHALKIKPGDPAAADLVRRSRAQLHLAAAKEASRLSNWGIAAGEARRGLGLEPERAEFKSILHEAETAAQAGILRAFGRGTPITGSGDGPFPRRFSFEFTRTNTSDGTFAGRLRQTDQFGGWMKEERDFTGRVEGTKVQLTEHRRGRANGEQLSPVGWSLSLDGRGQLAGTRGKPNTFSAENVALTVPWTDDAVEPVTPTPAKPAAAGDPPTAAPAVAQQTPRPSPGQPATRTEASPSPLAGQRSADAPKYAPKPSAPVTIAEMLSEAELAYREGKARVESKKPAEAVAYFRKAADLGHPDGQASLGALYLTGQGVRQDFVTAHRWLTGAAERKSALAQGLLGWAYSQGLGVKQDYARARQWFTLSAEQGEKGSQKNLGDLYARGLGGPRDTAQADKWYRRAAPQFHEAAQRGEADAQVVIGAMCLEGQGVDRSARQAADWFRRAADRGSAPGQRNLGILYLQGEGVPKDRREGLRWLKKAAAQGDQQAKATLAREDLAGEVVRGLLDGIRKQK